MEQTARVRVVVEMESLSDPISGTVETADAAPRPFTGWMDLVAALEEARGGDTGIPGTEYRVSEPRRPGTRLG